MIVEPLGVIAEPLAIYCGGFTITASAFSCNNYWQTNKQTNTQTYASKTRARRLDAS